ncbi:MAG: hypothetical protein Crog4KO_15170 [Crocinitomicaceae bacterium]
MASSITYTSPVDPDSTVLVTKESSWTNIKVYAKGSLQYSAENGEELRLGTTVDADGFGKIDMHLKSDLEITVNGTPYEMISKDAEEKVTNVSSIFWVLTGFSAIGFIFLLLAGITNPFAGELLVVTAALQLVALLIYGATAILLKRGVYWFYFIGASIYTFFSSLYLIDIEAQFSGFTSIAAFIIRFFLLFMMLRIIPTIIKEMRKTKPMNEAILDQ